MRCATVERLALVPVLLLGWVTIAGAENISGTITTTRTIYEDSQLVGHVICEMTTSPCIQFGAPNITLLLNGFIITGPADPDVSSTCNATSGTSPADGIFVNQTDARILGPGMVQKFRRHGILIAGTSRATVKHVTTNDNCFSGLFGSGMSASVIEGVVSVRNAMNSAGASCGGNCLFNSHNNHIWMSQFSGNGSVCSTANCTGAAPTIGSNNDFGIGLIGNSSGNLVESNSLGGNTNGILIAATASGNVIRYNTIAGNPAVQVSRNYGPIGFDIKDTAAANGVRNTFEKNWCVSYSGPGPSPCPNLPVIAPPTITGLTATPDVLWPANQKMVPIALTVTVSDTSDPAPVCQITGVSSNESLVTPGWTVTGPLALTLLADRAGSGAGRIYTITVTCTNNSQLSASETVTVRVPHDRGKE